MDRGAWWATVHGVKESDMMSGWTQQNSERLTEFTFLNYQFSVGFSTGICVPQEDGFSSSLSLLYLGVRAVTSRAEAQCLLGSELWVCTCMCVHVCVHVCVHARACHDPIITADCCTHLPPRGPAVTVFPEGSSLLWGQRHACETQGSRHSCALVCSAST